MMEKRPSVTTAASILWSVVGIWLASYFLFTIVSGKVLNSCAAIFQKYVWVELALLQQLSGALLGIMFAIITGKSKSILLPALNHKLIIFTASICNVTGNLAANAAFTIVPSSVAHIVESCQPLITMLILCSDGSVNVAYFLSVSIIVLGVSAIPVLSTWFNFFGFIAAAVSVIAFVVRNVLIKKLGNVWEGVLEKFFALSIVSTFILFPMTLLKVVITQNVFSTGLLGLAVTSAFQPVYNIASFKVLALLSLVSHSILAVFIRLVFYAESIEYTAIWKLLASFAVLSVGVFFYHKRKGNSWIAIKLAVFMVGMLILRGSITPTDHHRDRVELPSSSCSERPAQQKHNNRISMVWLNEEPIPSTAICNIESIAKQNLNSAIYIYCGTSQCVGAVTRLDLPNVAVTFAVISDIVKNTPLEQWLAHHPLNKVLAGKDFVVHLQEVAILGILCKYGGFYVNPMLVTTTTVPAIEHCNTSWVNREEMRPNSSLPSEFDLAYFPCDDSFLEETLQGYQSLYQKQQENSARIQFNFHNQVWEPVKRFFTNSGTNIPFPVTNMIAFGGRPLVNGPAKNHYSVSSSLSVNNLIENLAILQYFPYVDSFEDSNISRADATVFFDSEWGRSEKWPPPKDVNPIMLSVHVDDRTEKMWGENIDYFKEREPIGCRDTRTLNFMQQHNVQAFFSGPFLLLMTRPSFVIKKGSEVLVTDLQQDVIELLPRDIHFSSERFLKNDMYERHAGYKAAYRLVEMIASARVVITQNIDFAFLCVALKTPVVFIGSANKTLTDYELAPPFHYLNIQTTPKEQAKLWLKNFTWHAVPQNPNLATAMKLKTTLWDVIRQNSFVHQAALRLGTIPMSPLPSQGLLFHLIFTTSGKKAVSIFAGSKKYTGTSGNFNWRHMRTVESIFYHHPESRIIIHSNTLSQDQFNVFTEVGYSIEVQRYNLSGLLKESPAESFIGKLHAVERGQYWYSHQTDLVRLLLLYKYGGVYMDTDMILLRPLTSLPMNTLGFQDAGSTANGALMMFHKNSSYIKACLEDFATHYDGGRWSVNGPNLLSRVWQVVFSKKNSIDVHVMPQEYFYMFTWRVVLDQGFNQTSGEDFERNMRILKSEAYAIHLNSKITGHIGVLGDSKLNPGTIGSYVLNSFCILCNRMY